MGMLTKEDCRNEDARDTRTLLPSDCLCHECAVSSFDPFLSFEA